MVTSRSHRGLHAEIMKSVYPTPDLYSLEFRTKSDSQPVEASEMHDSHAFFTIYRPKRESFGK